ncbi:MAG: cell division protein FtsA [Candidatus Saccharimonas sp.]
MQDQSRYAVGIDIGTTEVRCVVGHIDSTNGVPTIVGVGHAPNSGMRKGIVVNLNGPAQAIDKTLGEAERMSGYEVNEATISINGSHIVSTKADGMVAVGMADREVVAEDVQRVEEVATVGKIPPNREILEVIPFGYTIDGQSGIKDPIGMSGTRLEIVASVVSAMTPYVENIRKAAEMATVRSRAVVPAVMAAARAVLTESQIESGVAVIDIGGATTSVAVFEEGDLQYVGVVPYGGVNITNDLAIGLKVDPSIAEKVKLSHAVASGRKDSEGVSMKNDKEILTFQTSDIDEIVEARLEEIFDHVNKELKKAGRSGQLPSGVVLVGGSANLKGITDFARTHLGVAARVGKPTGFGGVADGVDTPQYAAAVGLMLADAEMVPQNHFGGKGGKKAVSAGAKKARGLMGTIFGYLKP